MMSLNDKFEALCYFRWLVKEDPSDELSKVLVGILEKEIKEATGREA